MGLLYVILLDKVMLIEKDFNFDFYFQIELLGFVLMGVVCDVIIYEYLIGIVVLYDNFFGEYFFSFME